jgi:AcrR family transcriptional regulator
MSSGSADTRQRILAAARSLIEERGYDVGLGEIGKRAGISRQAVYLHFASKAQLLTELVTWVEEQADLGALLAPVWAASTGEQALRALIDAGAAFEPQIHTLARVTEHARDHDATINAIVADRMQRRYDGMRGVVARIAAEDRLAHGWDIDTAAAFVWALTAPAAFHLLVVERGWTPQHWAHHTYRLLHGALIRPDAPPRSQKAPASTAQGRPAKDTETRKRRARP